MGLPTRGLEQGQKRLDETIYLWERVNMSVKIGIIGAGGIGKVHLQAFKRNGYDVVAVGDVNEPAAHKLVAEEKLDGAVAGSPKDVYTHKEVQGVVVGVPNKFHKPLAIAALQAGKDVLVEKPMAMSVAEAKTMIAAAKKARKLLQIGFVHRYSTVGTAAKALIDAGRVGKIYHLKANCYRRRGIPGLGGWFTTKELSGGGPMIDLGVHVIDLVTFLAGHPKPLRASGKVYDHFGKDMKKYVYENMWAGPPRYDGKCDVEDSAHALVRLAPNITLEINVTWAGNFPEDSVKNIIGIFGDKGGVTFELAGKEVVLATEENGMNVDVKPNLRQLNAWDGQTHAFADAIKNRKVLHATGETGLYVQSILDAIYKSSAQNREVEIKG